MPLSRYSRKGSFSRMLAGGSSGGLGALLLIRNNSLHDSSKCDVVITRNTVFSLKHHRQVFYAYRKKVWTPFSNLFQSVFWPELFDLKTNELTESRCDFLGDISLVWRKIPTNKCNNKLPINYFRTGTPPQRS